MRPMDRTGDGPHVSVCPWSLAADVYPDLEGGIAYAAEGALAPLAIMPDGAAQGGGLAHVIRQEAAILQTQINARGGASLGTMGARRRARAREALNALVRLGPRHSAAHGGARGLAGDVGVSGTSSSFSFPG